jgi:hypothetical protein
MMNFSRLKSCYTHIHFVKIKSRRWREIISRFFLSLSYSLYAAERRLATPCVCELRERARAEKSAKGECKTRIKRYSSRSTAKHLLFSLSLTVQAAAPTTTGCAHRITYALAPRWREIKSRPRRTTGGGL